MAAPKTTRSVAPVRRLSAASLGLAVREELARAGLIPGSPAAPVPTANARIDTPAPTAHLDSHLSVLEGAWNRLREAADRIEGLADRIVGTHPTDGCAGTPPAPTPSSAVGKLEEAGHSIHAVIDRLLAGVQRLERL